MEALSERLVQQLRSLLAANQYEQTSQLLETVSQQLQQKGDATSAAVMRAAIQVCLTCERLHQELAVHERTYEELVTQEALMKKQLLTLLQIVNSWPGETAAAELNNSSFPAEPGWRDTPLWQRVQNLLHRLPHSPAPSANHVARLPVDAAAKSDELLTSALEPEPMMIIKENGGERPFLTVYCFGSFQIFEDEHLLDDWPNRKGKSIFKYLLMQRPNPTAKEVLMELFWPDSSPDAARNNLNVAIYGLRQALRNGYPDFSHVLFQEDAYLLNPDMTIWADVDAFDHYFQRAEIFRQQGDTEKAVRAYLAATELYQGEFLAEDRYEEWVLPLRQQYQQHYLAGLKFLGRTYYEQENFAACITACQKFLAEEPCHEGQHRRLMRTYCRQNQRHLALRQYHQCVAALKKELDVQPQAETVQLYESICRRQPTLNSNSV